MKNFTRLFVASMFVLGACAKKAAPPTNEFLSNATPDHTFSQVVHATGALGLELESSDPTSLTIVTKPKEIPVAQLLENGTFEEDSSRFLRGRYSYRILIADQGGQSRLTINTNVEAFFSGKQQGLNGTGGTNWLPGKSNGKLEQALFDQVLKGG